MHLDIVSIHASLEIVDFAEMGGEVRGFLAIPNNGKDNREGMPGLRQLAVSAGEMDQRFALGNLGADHFSDEDVVIARGDALFHGALDVRQDSRQQWHATLTAAPLQSVEAIVTLARETVGKLALAFAQYADSEVPGGTENVDDGNLMSQADQD
jgi:hypothetical protein